MIPNFVDTDRFAPVARRERARFDAFFTAACGRGDDGPVLMHVSNFRPVKRVGDLIEVLARVRRALPARLVLVGDGPERARAAERGRASSASRRTSRFLGPRADFADELPHADAFLLPSETESFGVAALEALSAGVPVFGYRVGGLPEVIGDDGGVLVEPFDVDGAGARRCSRSSRDPARRAALGAAARARAVARFRRDAGPRALRGATSAACLAAHGERRHEMRRRHRCDRRAASSHCCALAAPALSVGARHERRNPRPRARSRRQHRRASSTSPRIPTTRTRACSPTSPTGAT